MALKQQLIKEKAEARDEKSKLEEKRVKFFVSKTYRVMTMILFYLEYFS